MKHHILLSTVALLAACQTAPVAPAPTETTTVEVIETVAPPAAPTQGQQWLYGSAEARIALKQDWNAIAAYVEAKAASRPNTSVVLAPVTEDGATAETADFLACDADQPLAAVFDADETLIWNLGSMGYFTRSGVGFDPAIWDQWEKTGAGKAVAIPGVKDAFKRIRNAGVEIIVNTNRSNTNVQGSADTLKAAGLGEFAHGQTLYLRGDAPGGSGKDGRRYMISDTYCVIALAGDQLGDIADIFNDDALTPPERKALTAAPAFDQMWGNGWFILPNPVYGPSLAGTMDEVFPESTDWAPPKAEE
ncbi:MULTISPECIES: HAD family acid phosphatase [Hyphomonas]|uniref:5'-nucleotidase n=2 Tax=Hyphomonas adhaerens TaxID=81029 RepID=A0A069E2X3_9PROT|nr:HAD family acid phosphatase [Hyphomonas adhaerens]KCZ84273.1 5'-nucleotidase [Hyphomonas adhaerens MHS-3]